MKTTKNLFGFQHSWQAANYNDFDSHKCVITLGVPYKISIICACCSIFFFFCVVFAVHLDLSPTITPHKKKPNL